MAQLGIAGPDATVTTAATAPIRPVPSTTGNAVVAATPSRDISSIPLTSNAIPATANGAVSTTTTPNDDGASGPSPTTALAPPTPSRVTAASRTNPVESRRGSRATRIAAMNARIAPPATKSPPIDRYVAVCIRPRLLPAPAGPPRRRHSEVVGATRNPRRPGDIATSSRPAAPETD